MAVDPPAYEIGLAKVLLQKKIIMMRNFIIPMGGIIAKKKLNVFFL